MDGNGHGIYCIIYNVQDGEIHQSLSLETPLSYPRPSGLRWMSWEVSTMVPPMMAFKMALTGAAWLCTLRASALAYLEM